MTPISERQRARFYIYKKQKNYKTFIYKNPDTLQKERQFALRIYLYTKSMVVRAGGYYGEAFKGARGVTQGCPLSPTIFNVVLDSVVHHWVTMALAEVENRGERVN